MSKKSEKGLVPELRFPEFRKAAGWQEEPFGKLYSFIVTNSLSRDKLNYTTGEVKNIHYGDIHTKFATLFDVTKEKVPYINEDVFLDGYGEESFCAEGDMVFADASEDLEGVGKGIEIYKLNNERVLAGLHTLHARQTGKKLAPGFGGYLFLSDRIRGQIKRESQGAKVLGISGLRLSNVQVSYPNSKDEQKKIAACLASLDALLASEREKLEALRAHKKGLMQQLFPAEGEKVPRLRFPGFGGEWVESPLGSYTTIVRGGSPRPIDDFITTDEDGLNWLKIGDVGKDAKYVMRTEQRVIPSALSKTRVVAPGDLIMSNSMSFGRPYIMQMHSCIHDGWIAVTEINSKVDTEFLYYLISSDRSQTYFSNAAAGGGVKNLNADIIKVLPTLRPKEIKEQQAIASCLSALDEQMALQAERVQTLEDHKKGLMQSLFPTPDI